MLSLLYEILPEITMVILGGVCGFFRHQIHLLKKKNKEQQRAAIEESQTLRSAVRAIVRVELIREHNKRVKDGFCPSYAYESYVDLYAQYKALGGNGMVTRLKEEVDALPSKSAKGENHL